MNRKIVCLLTQHACSVELESDFAALWLLALFTIRCLLFYVAVSEKVLFIAFIVSGSL